MKIKPASREALRELFDLPGGKKTVPLLALLCLTLACPGGNGPQPAITSFTATPSQLPAGGGQVLLAWTTSNATKIELDDILGGDDVTGTTSKTVSVTQTKTFGLAAGNANGAADGFVTVTVAQAIPLPVITSFTATPSSLAGAGSTTLSWAATGATTLSIDHNVGAVTGSSVLVPNVAVTTTFTLTAANASGSVTAPTTVTVTPLPLPVISAFSATPSTLGTAGGTVTLAWTVTGADSLSLNPGGTVTGTGTTANIAATTTFTLTATNASGSVMSSPITVTVAVDADRYADSTNGLDSHDCTQAAPCKTIAKAFSVATSGHNVFLFDGTFGADTQGGAVINIPDGIALSAINPGAAILKNLHFTALGSTSVSGVVLDFVNNVGTTTITAASTTGTPALTLTGVLIKFFNALVIGGNVHATMLPGALPGGVYTTALPDGFGTILTLQGNAQLLIQGGIIDGNSLGQPAFGGALIQVLNNGVLTLDGATMRNRAQTVISTANTASVVLQNNTLFDHVSTIAGGSNCPTGAAVVLTGTSTLVVDHVSMTNLPGAAICVRGQSTVTIDISSSTFAAFWGVVAEIGSGQDAVATIDRSSFTGGAFGIEWIGVTSASNFLVTNSTFQGMSQTGASFDGSGGNYKLRNCSFLNNHDGVDARDGARVDLGTAADPGGNTLTGNSTTGLLAALGDPAADALSTTAVGNTWVPLAQGADAAGHFGDGVVVTGPANGSLLSGPNFTISNKFTSIDL
jgi:hypothetical protein